MSEEKEIAPRSLLEKRRERRGVPLVSLADELPCDSSHADNEGRAFQKVEVPQEIKNVSNEGDSLKA